MRKRKNMLEIIKQLAVVISIIIASSCMADQIQVTEHCVFDGTKGWQHEDMTYRLACAAIVTELNNGELVVLWISGSDNEPATDNCAVMAKSCDSGKTWSEPWVLAPANDGMMTVCSNIYQLADGRVVALWAKLPVEGKYTIWHYYRMYSDDNCITWSQPEPFGVFKNDGASLFEGRPLRLANGGYFFAGTCMFKREKPLLAPVKELSNAVTEEQALSMPEGKGNNGNVFAKNLHGCAAFISSNEDGRGMSLVATITNRPMGLLEPTCLQLKDGSITMLMRAQYDGFLWRADSKDNGRTWTPAYRTDIPNPSSMANLVRMSDGRIVLLHNNTSGPQREPLSIWVSRDEMKTWYTKQDVIYGGKLAYPNGIVLKNGRLVFVYDRDRRQVRFVEVELPTID